MRKILLLIVALGLSCSAPKIISFVQMIKGCPSDGNCTIEIIQNKSLEIFQDSYGSTKYKLGDSDKKAVIKFKYSRKVKGNIQDAGYREEILLEIENNGKGMMHSDLKNTSALVGRFCFCKGQTGYYKIDSGDLTKNGNQYHLKVSVIAVPQIVKEIRFSLQ